MLRPVITATALIALVGSSLAFAQHNFGGGSGSATTPPAECCRCLRLR